LFFFLFLVKVTVKFIRRGTWGEKGEKHFLFPTQEMGARTPFLNTRVFLRAYFIMKGLESGCGGWVGIEGTEMIREENPELLCQQSSDI
jgi:hypothetical protein